MIPAFGAAALGWFTSIPFAYLGGLAIGVGQSLLTRYLTVDWLSDLPVVLPFVVLFVVDRHAEGTTHRAMGDGTSRAASGVGGAACRPAGGIDPARRGH